MKRADDVSERHSAWRRRGRCTRSHGHYCRDERNRPKNKKYHDPFFGVMVFHSLHVLDSQINPYDIGIVFTWRVSRSNISLKDPQKKLSGVSHLAPISEKHQRTSFWTESRLRDKKRQSRPPPCGVRLYSGTNQKVHRDSKKINQWQHKK